IPLPHRVKSPPEQYAVSVRFGIAEGPAVFRVLLRSAPPVGVSWRMAYTMETSRTTIACLLVEYSSSAGGSALGGCGDSGLHLSVGAPAGAQQIHAYWHLSSRRCGCP